MKTPTIYFILAFLIAIVAPLQAGSLTVPSTFTAGTPAVAAEVNANFTAVQNAVDDNDVRITTNGSDIATNASNITALQNITPDYSGYLLPFSAIVDPKNVVVLKQTNSDGSGNYIVRSAYANSTEQIRINGMMTTRPFIFNYVDAAVDTNGVLTSLSNYLEAPLTSAWLDIVQEESTYNISSGAKTVTADTRSELYVCSAISVISACDITEKTNGVQTGFVQALQVFTLLGSGTIGSMTFSDLRGEHKLYNT